MNIGTTEYAASDTLAKAQKMDGDELRKVTSTTFFNAGIDPFVRGDYRPRKLANLAAYMLSVAAIAIPPIGLVAASLAVRGWGRGSRKACSRCRVQ